MLSLGMLVLRLNVEVSEIGQEIIFWQTLHG